MKYKEEKKKAEKAEINWWLFDIPEDKAQEFKEVENEEKDVEEDAEE
jgi:hypothetical protein